MVHQGKRVEDALDNPDLFRLEHVDARRAPPHTFVGLPRLEAGLHLAEARRLVDQAFPISAFL
ncbi:hypothetical protein D3C72_1801720 [compost metagenome]